MLPVGDGTAGPSGAGSVGLVVLLPRQWFWPKTVRGHVPREILHPSGGVLPGIHLSARGRHWGRLLWRMLGIRRFCESDAGSFFSACPPYLGGPKKGKGGKKAKR